MAAQEDRIRELEEQLANASQAGGGGGRLISTNFEKRSVKDMSDPQRLALLKAMDECSVCKDKHFGGKGPGRCLADPSVPLPSNFEQMVRPRRRAKIYRLRGNIEKAVAIEKTLRANAVETEELITLDTLEEMEGDASADHVRGEDCEDQEREEFGPFTFSNMAMEEGRDEFEERAVDPPVGGEEMKKTGCRKIKKEPMGFSLLMTIGVSIIAMGLGVALGSLIPQVGASATEVGPSLTSTPDSPVALPVNAILGDGVDGGTLLEETVVPNSTHESDFPSGRYPGWYTYRCVAAIGALTHSLMWLRRMSPRAFLAAALIVGGFLVASAETLPKPDKTISIRNEVGVFRDEYAMATSVGSPGNFLIDSGATMSCIVNRGWFSHYRPTDKASRRFVRIANGQRVPVIGIGTIKIPVKSSKGDVLLALKECLHVPGLSANLLSTRSMWKREHISTRLDDVNSLVCLDQGFQVPFEPEPFYHLRAIDAPRACYAATQGKRSREKVPRDIMHLRLGGASAGRLRNAARLCADVGPGWLECPDKACHWCEKANQNVQPSNNPSPIPTRFGHLSLDFHGPNPPTMFKRHRYLLLFKDLRTGYEFMRTCRSRDEFPELLLSVLAEAGAYGKVYRIHRDNATEFESEKVVSICHERGIHLTNSPPHTPKGNAVSERPFQTHFATVRRMFSHGSALRPIPVSLWDHAIAASVDISNRTTPSRCDPEISRHEALVGHAPRVGHLRPPFCRAYMKVPPPDLPPGHKVHDKGVPCIHLAYSYAKGGYLFFVPGWNVIRVSRNATFVEDEFPGLAPDPDASKEHAPEKVFREVVSEGEGSEDEEGEGSSPSPSTEGPPSARLPRGEGRKGLHQGPYGKLALEDPTSEDAHAFLGVAEGEVHAYLGGEGSQPTEPTKFHEIAGRPDEKEWLESVHKELKNMVDMGVFRAKHRLSKVRAMGAPVTKLSWAFKHKVNAEGTLGKRKSRLAGQDIKGLFRFEGRDFETASSTAIRYAAAYLGLHVFQLDFTGAYLQTKVPEGGQEDLCAPATGVPGVRPRWGPVGV